jgi:predicted flap endonuclease-1-like 5' DNA nuclease
VCQALAGNYRAEHIFALTQALELYDVYQTKVLACDKQIEAILKRLKKNATPPADKLTPARQRTRQPNAPAFDARAALHAILGVDLTQIDGLGPYLALKLVGECGTSLAAWPTAKHFTSWLALAPHNKISGGKVLSSKTRRTLTTPLIFLPPRSCADSYRFPTRSGNFRDEFASWGWKRRSCAMADG